MSDSRVRLRRHVRVWADGLTYALALTAIAGLGSYVLAIATGGGAVRANTILFLAGWVLLAVATLRLWPSSPEDVEPEQTPRRTGESLAASEPATRFQAFVRKLPPVRWVQLPRPERRMTGAGKLFLSAVLILLCSFLLETAFGVA